MVDLILRQYRFNYLYAEALVSNLSEHQMTEVPSGGLINHPAFTLGHLVSGSALIVQNLGGNFNLPEGWKELFLRKGPGDSTLPEKDTSLYPTKIALLQELKRQHLTVEECLLNTDIEQLSMPKKWRFSSYMPTLIDSIVFLSVNHEAMHLGQLAAWRRAMNLPSALAKL